MTSPLEVVQAWGRALASFDEEALVGLAAEEIEIVGPRGTRRGHDALREWLAKQTYGVVPHVEPRRYFARGGAVVVVVRVELRYLEEGKLASAFDAVAAYAVEDGLVRKIVTHTDLDTALADAGLSRADEVAPA